MAHNNLTTTDNLLTILRAQCMNDYPYHETIIQDDLATLSKEVFHIDRESGKVDAFKLHDDMFYNWWPTQIIDILSKIITNIHNIQPGTKIIRMPKDSDIEFKYNSEFVDIYLDQTTLLSPNKVVEYLAARGVVL